MRKYFILFIPCFSEPWEPSQLTQILWMETFLWPKHDKRNHSRHVTYHLFISLFKQRSSIPNDSLPAAVSHLTFQNKVNIPLKKERKKKKNLKSPLKNLRVLGEEKNKTKTKNGQVGFNGRHWKKVLSMTVELSNGKDKKKCFPDAKSFFSETKLSLCRDAWSFGLKLQREAGRRGKVSYWFLFFKL